MVATGKTSKEHDQKIADLLFSENKTRNEFY